MSTFSRPVDALPPEIARDIEGQDNSTASTILSVHRTRLGVKRTGLADLRSHLANERTHVAYLRTSISLIGFGITINRFSIFLQERGSSDPGRLGSMLRSSEHAGAGMVLVGLALTVWSLYRYWHVNRDITTATFRPLHRAVVMLTVLLILGGGVTAALLFLNQ